MTTRITIKNEEESGHSIEITRSGLGPASFKEAILQPGQDFTVYVWEGSGVSIAEIPNEKVV